MRLFRVFDWDGRSLGARVGGPLFVHRARQGAGRHDVPDLSGAWYLSQSPVAAVAEALQYLRGHTITADDFTRVGGLRKALAVVDLADDARLIDLDDPRELDRREWRPSRCRHPSAAHDPSCRPRDVRHRRRRLLLVVRARSLLDQRDPLPRTRAAVRLARRPAAPTLAVVGRGAPGG